MEISSANIFWRPPKLGARSPPMEFTKVCGLGRLQGIVGYKGQDFEVDALCRIFLRFKNRSNVMMPGRSGDGPRKWILNELETVYLGRVKAEKKGAAVI